MQKNPISDVSQHKTCEIGFFPLNQHRMNEFTEVFAGTLRFIRGAHGKTQDEIAELLGIPVNAVSNIENDRRALSDSEKRLLDWYFFGTLPPRLAASFDLRGILEFTEDEWNIIGLMARRAGQNHAQWIRSSILAFVHSQGPGSQAGDQGKAAS